MESHKSVIVGTAGHIDHGKSALVEALTGVNPDRLEEEKRRGITIDLGFAFLEFEDVRFGFVDVPGHERFVRNMLAGAGGVDLILLVIAADESIKPQTIEHFDICRLLGISQGVIALTKSDLVDADGATLVRLEIEDFVRGSFLEGAPIIPVSARTGEGLDSLQARLLEAARRISPRDTNQYFRLPVDRAFAQKGFGTVVTGTLISGSVAPGDEAELFPSSRRVRIRGVQSAGKPVPRARAGERTAANLAGVDLADVSRGMVLAAPNRFLATQTIDARLALLSSAPPARKQARFHFHQGTSVTIATLLPLEEKHQQGIPPDEAALVQLRLRDSLLLLPGDRFILRRFSPVTTVGGGIVLDAQARRHRRCDSHVLAGLQALEKGPAAEILLAYAGAHPAGLELSQVVVLTGWLESKIRTEAESLAALEKLILVSQQPFVIASPAAFEELCRSLDGEVENFHSRNPLAPGIAKEELRSRAAPRARPELFQAALQSLQTRGKISIAEELVAHAGHAITLRPEEAVAKEALARELERAGLAVPSLEEVLAKLPVDREHARKLVQLLLREKVLVRVAEGLLFHASAIALLRNLLAASRRERGDRLSVAAFKEITGVSRKYAIPLLEYLDRERLTRREGDDRVIL